MLKDRFLENVGAVGASNIRWLVVAVKLPNGVIEIITNSQNIKTKIDYYDSAYDDLLRLKTNPDISIVNWLIV